MAHLSPKNKDIQVEWKQKTIKYAKSVNRFVEKGLSLGWENAGTEPKDPNIEKLVPHLIKAIRKANKSGNFERLRFEWPLAHSPLIPILNKNGQSIPTVCILDDKTIVARIGAPYKKGYVVQIQELDVKVVPNIEYFGRSPNRKYFAYSKENGVSVTDGWLGEEVSFCPYPKGTEGIPVEYNGIEFDQPPIPTKLIPFPDGSRVLFISSEGIFVLSENEAVRLLPTLENMKDYFEYLKKKERSDDRLSLNIDMEHGAISPDGKFIAVGSQDSLHLIFNDKLELIAKIGHRSEYPHYAIFSDDGDMVAFNSCHFYNGITIGVPVKLLPGLETKAYKADDRTPILENGSRVYAGTFRKDEFIIGDASGYLRAFNKQGKPIWQHFIGSSVGDIDISADKTIIVCSTYAGFISILELDKGKSEDYEIGNGGHTESRRWLFWEEEEQPLAW